MYGAASRFDVAEHFRTPPPPRLERAEGRLRLKFRTGANGQSRLDRCYQRGALKVRFPRPATATPEPVLINTAGGMTGGDRFRVSVELGDGAAATLATQAAEKIYRSTGDEACVDTLLTLGPRARLYWLPQETILFDGGRLARRLEVAMAGDARLIACEGVILGRAAFGETVRSATLTDNWHIRRDGRLIHAEALRLAGDIAELSAGHATLGGCRAFATILAVAPDAEQHLDRVRQALEDSPATAGASAWNGLLAARIVTDDGRRLRAAMLAVLRALGIAPPRIWSI